MTTINEPPVVQQPPPQPPKRRRFRSKGWVITGSIAGGVLILAGVGLAASGGTTPTTNTNPAPAASAPASPSQPSPPPVPLANASVHGSGNADYVIPSGIYDPVLLTGEVDLTNTGNVGEVVRVRMHWERTGFPDITQTRTVRVPWGTSVKVVQFNKNMGSFSGAGSNIIDEVQSYQEAHPDQAYGDFTLKILRTFGPVHA